MILQEFPEGFDCLAWVPVSRWRKFHRGYDQVELLADAVGRELDMEPVKLLRKIRNNPPQSGIHDAAARRANVLGVYDAVGDAAGKRILLVDDVISTGESLTALEALVEKAGGIIAGRMAILAEGDAQDREDLIYLEPLPLFNPDGTVMG